MSELDRPYPVPPRPALPFRRLIPNIVTVLSLCAGMTAIRFAWMGKFELAVAAIIVASVFDSLDGLAARLLKATSKFGAELDSLSDSTSFGVAPAMILYIWTLHDIKGVGWTVALAFAVCCALRLARFNTMIARPPSQAWRAGYFVGIPAPAGAGIALMPMMLWFETGLDFWRNPLFCVIHVAIVSVLMISELPAFSLKRVTIRRRFVVPLLAAIGLVASLLTSYLWGMLACIGLAYLISLPIAWRAFRKQKLAAEEEAEQILGA